MYSYVLFATSLVKSAQINRQFFYIYEVGVMASVKQMETKAGKRFFKICVSRGYGNAPYKMRWYWPMTKDGHPVSEKTAKNELQRVVAEFERACAAGEFKNRAETKQLAAEAAAKAAEEAAKAAEQAAKLKTVKQYVDGVFMPTKETTLSENSRANYQMFLDKHILPVIGDMFLVDVTAANIKKMLIEFQKAGYSHATCIKLYNILNGLFDMAFEDDSISISPMLKVKRPVPRKDEPIKDEDSMALTASELQSVLACVANEPLKWQAYITLAADTGARRGELCGLQWQDLDFKSGTINICRNLQYTKEKGVYVDTPKNKKSRYVDLGPETLNLLHLLREQQATSCISKWVFTQDGTAEPMHPQSPTRYFKKFGERYGFQDFHPHKLRHTSASLMMTSGKSDIKSIAARLGHSEAILLKRYAHANEESIRRAGQAARDAVKAVNQ